MNYSNVFPDGDEFKFRVMVAREFYEKGGFATEAEAAWECDKVRLWAGDLCGRKVAYNFPERITNISESEFMNPPAEVSMFLHQLREKRGTVPEFHTADDVARARNGVLGAISPEAVAAQLVSLDNLRDLSDTLLAGIMAGKFSAGERDALVKKVNALRGDIVEAIARRS